MLYCIEVDRSGLPEENIVEHANFEKEPTRAEIIEYIKSLDYDYDDDYCDVEFYRVDK